MQKGLSAFEEADLVVVGVSYDSVEVLAKFAKSRKVTFPLLSDPASKTIEDYGLVNKEAKGKIKGVPYPGTILVGKDGRVQAKIFHDGYRERHQNDDLLKAAAKIK